jgi:hypothetical protein
MLRPRYEQTVADEVAAPKNRASAAGIEDYSVVCPVQAPISR